MQHENTPATSDRHQGDLEVDVKVTIIVATRDGGMVQVSRAGLDADLVLGEATGEIRRILGARDQKKATGVEET
ncbi:hypothetical protein GCM10009710_32040 [Aeromicrobium alkaliterrae]|uniref:Uncharacterized protein n=1 Tax=Aeromicrobium alkaliterrae TaxID=302168 RepID=A0ABN2K709_9ACTN